MSTVPFHIAIDGPEAAGKGTVSKLTAERLGFLYVDTGAMYRVTALLGIQQGISFDDESGLAKLIRSSDMQLRNPTPEEKDGRLITVLLNGEDVSWQIRTPEVGQGSSKVAIHPEVRKELVIKQQQIAAGQDVVMEGRDITFRVLPDAQLKIFLTASDVVRAQRRFQQQQTKGVTTTLDKVYQDLLERDQRDKSRATDPLQIVEGAWVLDTSELAIEEVVNLIVAKAKAMRDA